MLDDLKYIHSKDPQDAFGAAAKQWQQLEAVFELEDLRTDFENVVFAGMGGSALWALLATTWPGCSVPFEIWRRYDAPKYVSNKTLFIANSFSGNTEETVSALEAGMAAGAKVVVVAGGGKMIEIAKDKQLSHIVLPKVPQPRYGAFAGLKSLVVILQKAGLIGVDNADETLEETAEFLKLEMAGWAVDVPSDKNPAKRLAQELAGTSPVIYAGTAMYPAAYKWKISFNENAKNVAWCNEIPEFAHNEFLGWSSHPVEKPYGIVDLRSEFEHERIQKRFEVTERMLSGLRPHTHVVDAKGDSILEQLLYCVAFGDFVTLYTAMLNGVNPTPVDLVEKMKVELTK